MLVKASETGWLMRSSPQTPLAMKGEQMAVKAANHRYQIHGVLHGVGVGCRFFLDGNGTVGEGDSIGHLWLLGLCFKEQ